MAAAGDDGCRRPDVPLPLISERGTLAIEKDVGAGGKGALARIDRLAHRPAASGSDPHHCPDIDSCATGRGPDHASASPERRPRPRVGDVPAFNAERWITETPQASARRPTAGRDDRRRRRVGRRHGIDCDRVGRDGPARGGGPGGARNAGLAQPEARFIQFLGG
jgi:hypothetical protein